MAAVIFLLAGGIAMFGKKEVQQATPATPERAVAGLKEDVATVKGGHQA